MEIKVTKEDLKYLRDLFIQKCPSLPKPMDVDTWSPGRVDRAKRAIRRYGCNKLGEVFARVEKSDFLSGRNGRWGKCGIDWILKPENFSKIMEGNYDNRPSKTSSFDLDEALKKATICSKKVMGQR